MQLTTSPDVSFTRAVTFALRGKSGHDDSRRFSRSLSALPNIFSISVSALPRAAQRSLNKSAGRGRNCIRYQKLEDRSRGFFMFLTYIFLVISAHETFHPACFGGERNFHRMRTSQQFLPRADTQLPITVFLPSSSENEHPLVSAIPLPQLSIHASAQTPQDDRMTNPSPPVHSADTISPPAHS